MYFIKNITALETFLVRHPVLRTDKPIEDCHFDGDNLESTIHFGLYFENTIVGVISLFEAKNVLFDHKKQNQIRGMAVLKEYQKQGFGEKLVKYAESHCIQRAKNLIWFNARKEAISFYQKMGYKPIGEFFEIPEIGLHIQMFKILDQQ
ncbi:GNAT superfamily N-acetyltransferase [Flavobacterium sp. PL11]|jgi:GNAT superfamily N-acetyltransferase|uniref:GNAT family N-acetyltransferase n=1 Tax=Flavobacterium sp. PL11 TaxID=3071717 RepID=UPI002E0AB7E2|nr:GNAT superfamily N-acetyltransferase [Flavobacterium sp. PL11]